VAVTTDHDIEQIACSGAPLEFRGRVFHERNWLYVVGGALIGFGFIEFSLIAFYFQRARTFNDGVIPMSYRGRDGHGAVGNYSWDDGSIDRDFRSSCDVHRRRAVHTAGLLWTGGVRMEG